MWAKGIIAAFIVFAAFIVTLVTICVKQDISLESKDYYKEELEYQKKLDRFSNTTQLGQRPKISYHDDVQQLSIDFTDTRALNGKIQLYKPDKASQDFSQNFDNDFELDMRHKGKGLW
ncbi:MAG TPA: FixH family protein, partial [Cytophagales bacterium]|nr:FixH family protein [Cytophagales bacterium]